MEAAIVEKRGFKNRPDLHKLVLYIAEFLGLEIVRIFIGKPTEEFCKKWYEAHSKKDFFKELVSFMSGDENMFIVVKGGPDVVKKVRMLVDVVRILFEVSSKSADNVIHGSGSDEDANKEVGLIIDWLKS